MGTDIFNQLISQYTGCITNIQTGSITLGLEIFNAVALISVGLLGLNHLLRKNVDMADANFELIRWLIYLDFFYAIITNYPKIYPFIFSSIQQIGNYLGVKAAGGPLEINPLNIIAIGASIAKAILFTNVKFKLFKIFFLDGITLLTTVVVMYCFAVICLELVLVQIGSQIILAGGIFLLAFSGLQWTRDYAERYVHTFFHIGIKMIFIYILIGVGIGYAKNWTQLINQASLGQLFDYEIAVIMSTFVYYKLCIKLPDQAVSFLTGRLSMGFEAATSVNVAIKAPAKIATVAVGGAAGIAGMSKAIGTAAQVAKTNLASQGKKANIFNTGREVVKTLGQANREVKQDSWDRKVDDSQGGKIAKKILEDIPKLKKITRRNTKKDPNEDYEI